MDEVRCPMCGKPNPADLEQCQYCQARLKPLVASTPPQETPSEPEPAAPQPPAPDPAEPPSPGEDWLSDLRQGGDEDLPETGPLPSEKPEESQDWLSRLRGQTGDDEEPEVEPGSEDDWIPEEEIEEEADVPDWLSRIRDRAAEEVSPDEIPPEALETRESFSLSFDDQEEPFDDLEGPEELEPQAEDLPDWLRGEPSEGPPDEVPPEALETRESFSLSFDDQEEPAEEADVPAWLRSIRPGEIDQPVEAEPPADMPPVEVPPEALETREVPGLSFRDQEEPAAEADVPEWLRGLRSEETERPAAIERPEETEPAAEEPAAEAGVPEWLQTQQPEEPEAAAEPPTVKMPPADVPPDEVPPEALETREVPGLSFRDQEEPAEEADVPEWLRGLRPEEAEAEKTPPAPPEPARPEAAPAEDLPEWLEGEPAAEVPAEDVPSEALETREVPGLSFRDQEEPAEDAGVPEWLRGLGAEESEEMAEPAAPAEPPELARPEAAEEEPEAAPAEDLPDWLAGVPAPEEFELTIPEEPPAEALETKEIPGLGFQDQEEPAEAAPELEAAPAEDLPDWLRSSFDEFPAEDMPPAEALETKEIPGLGFEAPEEAAEPGEVPDWLQSVAPGEFEFETEALPEEAEQPEPIEPGWIGAPEETEKLPQPVEYADLEAVEESPGPEGEIPDWLQEPAFEGEPAQPLETKQLSGLAFEEEDELAGEVPAWPEEEALEPAEAEPAWMQTGETDREPPVALEDEDMPDWLRGLQAVQEEAGAEDQEAVFTEMEEPIGPLAEEEAEAVPGWLAELRARTGAAPETDDLLELPAEEALPPAEAPADEEEVEIIRPGDLPEWISDIPVEAEAAEEDVDLAPAELPGWLQAMRPVEAVTPGQPSPEAPAEGVEGVGPLAGLHGILPAEPEITQAGKTPEFSTRVEVTQKQHNHIALLKDLLGDEAQPRVRKAPLVSVQPLNILRWAIAVILLLAITAPLLGDLRATPAPTLLPTESLAVGEIIGGLPDGAAVLVAFDYQPGLSAELEAAASGVVDHLMVRGANLTLVSTSPTGPALAERFITRPDGVGVHNYVYGLQYINLGYIPGGAAGLLEFSANPRGTFPLPFNLQGLSDSNPWSSAPLQGVQALTDFSLVLVLVDEANVARAWVEQVGTRLEQVPLVMVTSAQLTPVVRPYYQTEPRQVDGLVSGLPGGVVYERITGRDMVARNAWDAFSNGLMMVELLIVVGGVVSVGLYFWNQRQPETGEAEE